MSQAMFHESRLARKMPRKFHLALIRKFQPYSWFLTVKARPLANQSGNVMQRDLQATSLMFKSTIWMRLTTSIIIKSDAIVSRIKEFLENN